LAFDLWPLNFFTELEFPLRNFSENLEAILQTQQSQMRPLAVDPMTLWLPVEQVLYIRALRMWYVSDVELNSEQHGVN